MARHPAVQKKAQEEIDRVVGPDRLPAMHDKPFLPYVNHLIAEVLRFNPVVPVIPHSLDEDDVRILYSVHILIPILMSYLAPLSLCNRYTGATSYRKAHGSW